MNVLQKPSDGLRADELSAERAFQSARGSNSLSLTSGAPVKSTASVVYAAVATVFLAGCGPPSTPPKGAGFVRYTPELEETIRGMSLVEAKALRAKIDRGRELFMRDFSEQDGLGGATGGSYNSTSCLSCHNEPSIGGAGPIDREICVYPDPKQPTSDVEISPRFKLGSTSVFPHGCPSTAEMRRAPPVYGLGWTLNTSTGRYVRDHAGTGKVTYQHVDESENLDKDKPQFLGAQTFVTDVRMFVATALASELGLVLAKGIPIDAVQPDIKPAISLEDWEALVAFMQYLDRPVDPPNNAAGEEALEKVGCTPCHRKNLAPEVAKVWTDGVMHRMGPFFAKFGLLDKGNQGVEADHRKTRSLVYGAYALSAKKPLGSTGHWTSLSDYIRETHGGEAAASSQKFFEDPAMREGIETWFGQ